MSEGLDDYSVQPAPDQDEVRKLAIELFMRITAHQATTNPIWDPHTKAKYDAKNAIAAAFTFFDCWDKTQHSDTRVTRYY